MAKKVFISFSSIDKKKMKALERKLQKSNFLIPIIASEDREPLRPLTEKVRTGIKAADYVVPIITKSSINTQWLNQEIGYATAIDKDVRPIVESEIIDLLKGFIHKNIDLPYYFSDSEQQKTSRRKFRNVCDLVIADLLDANHIGTSNMLLKLFPDTWSSVFKGAGGLAGRENQIEIKSPNKFYAQGQHWFNIEDFSYEPHSGRITFTKVGVPGHDRRLKNTLTIKSYGNEYEGEEYNERENVLLRINYQKTPIANRTLN